MKWKENEKRTKLHKIYNLLYIYYITLEIFFFQLLFRHLVLVKEKNHLIWEQTFNIHLISHRLIWTHRMIWCAVHKLTHSKTNTYTENGKKKKNFRIVAVWDFYWIVNWILEHRTRASQTLKMHSPINLWSILYIWITIQIIIFFSFPSWNWIHFHFLIAFMMHQAISI